MHALPLTPPTGALIGGHWVDTADTLEVLRPASGEVIARIAASSAADVDAAVAERTVR